MPDPETHEAPLRIAIVGAGGVGGLLGALLARTGQRVGFVVRSESLRAIRESALRVSTPFGAFALPAPEATDRPVELGAADVVFLGTKSYDLARSARASAPMLRDGIDGGTLVVTLQNGVEAESVVRAALPGAAIHPGVVYVASTRTSPGEIVQKSRFFRLAFGPSDGRVHPLAPRLESACREAGIAASLTPGMDVPLWTKFVFIASVSAATCTTGLRIGPLLGDEAARASLTAAMAEVAAVARARGIVLAHDVVERSLEIAASLPADATSSMHEDLLAGRPLEVESLSGAVVRLGCEAGVPTPVHAAAYERLRDRAVSGGPSATRA